MNNLNEEYRTRLFEGEVTDIVKDLKTGKEIILPTDHNIIVNNASVLLACLLKGQSGYTGLGYWEVGSGLESWDATPYTPVATNAGLITPVFRKAIQSTDITFIDASNNVSATPTNRLKVEVIFLSGEANTSLREFALFGGNATATLGSGIMVNHKSHSKIVKDTTMELRRIIRFTW